MPAASAGATAASTRSAIIAISVLLRRPPPETTHSRGCSGKCSRARAMLAAVKAVSVAAPSSRERPATGAGEKALRSSDFGGSLPK